jgi:hypothetical protein
VLSAMARYDPGPLSGKTPHHHHGRRPRCISATAAWLSRPSPPAPTPPTPTCCSAPALWPKRRWNGAEGAAPGQDLLAPGSRVVTRYLERAGLLPARGARLSHRRLWLYHLYRQQRSAPRRWKGDWDNDLNVAAVLSGNRNFEARIHQLVKSNFLASPLLVVAFALAGRIDLDLTRDPLALDPNGQPGLPQGHLAEHEEVSALAERHVR